MDNGDNPKLAIGIILCGESTAKYLPYFLPSLKNQTVSDFKVVAFNNSPEERDGNEEQLKNFFPEAEILQSEKNLGFGVAHNRMIKKAFLMRARYFLAINADTILEPEAIFEMIKVLEENESLGSVSPKVLKWDFEGNKKTDIIDTCGIKIKPGLRFFDVGQGRKDNQKFYKEKIIGPSGACGLYRIKALEKIKEAGEYFDELMFMYKEDCDLAYKLSLIDFGSKSVPQAVVYHDRTASGKGLNDLAVAINRKSKSQQIKIWSFRGQQIIFIKYWHLQDLWSKINIIIYQIKVFLYILLFEQYLIKEFLTVQRNKDKIKIYK